MHSRTGIHFQLSRCGNINNRKATHLYNQFGLRSECKGATQFCLSGKISIRRFLNFKIAVCNISSMTHYCPNCQFSVKGRTEEKIHFQPNAGRARNYCRKQGQIITQFTLDGQRAFNIKMNFVAQFFYSNNFIAQLHRGTCRFYIQILNCQRARNFIPTLPLGNNSRNIFCITGNRICLFFEISVCLFKQFAGVFRTFRLHINMFIVVGFVSEEILVLHACLNRQVFIGYTGFYFSLCEVHRKFK